MSFVDRIKADIGQDTVINELSALLRYSQVPTLVVEGRNDVRVCNMWIEQRLLGTYRVDVLAAEGLQNLLRLYQRRSEFVHAPVIFIADREMCLFSGIPEGYEDIIWTSGYSIENDIYSESKIERLIQYNPTIEYDKVKEAVIKWFAFEVEEYFNTKSQRGTPNLGELISEGETELNKDFLKKYEFNRPPRNSTIKDIEENYLFSLPGKLLFQMLERFSGITFDGLYNTALANYNAEQHSIIGEIRRKLDEQGSISSQKILTKFEEQSHPEKDQNQFLPENKSTTNSESLVGRLAKKETVVKGNNAEIRLEGRLAKKEIILKGNNAEILKALMEKDKNSFSPITIGTSSDDLLSLYSKQQLSIYVVDREMRVFSETPERYLNVIWTKGYSLENDLYIDGGLENLIDPHEKWKHRQVLNATIKWFAFEVEEFLLNGQSPEISDDKLSRVVLPGQLELNKKLCDENNFDFDEPPVEHIQKIKEAYKYLLPGKYLFQILERSLNTRGRSFNYQVNFQRLLDIALSTSRTQQALDELAEQIRAKLDSIENQVKGKPKIKVEDKITAEILKKEGNKVNVQLMTDNREEITFERPYYPKKVGEEVKLRVTAVDSSTGKITAAIPIGQKQVKVGDDINGKILSKDGFIFTAQLSTKQKGTKKKGLRTKNKGKITFEENNYPIQVWDEHKFKVSSLDNLGRITQVNFISPRSRPPKVNGLIRAKILDRDSSKLTVQLMTKNEEKFTFKGVFVGEKGKETMVRVDSVDSTGKVIKATFKGLKKSNS